ncbi:MAG: hypothetical protein AB1505_19030 [Candidatus Latescibacterota bacterium]
MQRSRGYLAAGLALGLLSAAAFAAVDLTPDAVTQATSLNPVTGEVAALTDGRTPDLDPAAPAFVWGSVGLLRVEWDRPIRLATIRVYLGVMDQYAVYGYLGGRFTETGQRQGGETPVFVKQGLGPLEPSGWFEIACPADTPIDNLGLQVTGGATLYEIQFLGPGSTAVVPASLGLVKRAAGR